MKLQNLTIIFVIIIIPVILLLSLYISTGIKTIKYQAIYDSGLLTATHDAIYAFEQNTARDIYADNPERKRDILKSSVKMFEKSLANTCNISSYNTDEIEEYIPAIVFGMYDGFYVYAPSGVYNSQTGKTQYKHNLKNYVYYSETLDDGTVIKYSLDNYITVSGYFNGKYEIREGYLINPDGTTENERKDGSKYKGINIDTTDDSAVKYYKEAYYFTDFLLNKSDFNLPDYLKPSNTNDPEDENSAFVQHKRQIIKNKIEGVLNSTITAYSNRTWGQTYKMPKLSEEDWEKIYSNISMITFFQGKRIGLTKYNGYCVLNSTNSNEYVNSNLMYFIDSNDEYHDIRCTGKAEGDLTGYKIGDFKRITIEETDDDGNTTKSYEYKHKELACYECVNGSLSATESVQSYLNSASDEIKAAYWTSLARERYNTTKLMNTQINNDEHTITFKLEDTIVYQTITAKYGDTIEIPNNPTKEGYTFAGWDIEVPETMPDRDIIVYAKWNKTVKVTLSENYSGGKVLSKTVAYQGKYGALPIPTREGYAFEGWYTSREEKITSETIVETNENHTLYAKWIQKQYSINLIQTNNAGATITASRYKLKFDVYVNGTRVEKEVNNFNYTNITYGSTIKIIIISSNGYYKYNEAEIRMGDKVSTSNNSSLEITVTDNVNIELKLKSI